MALPLAGVRVVELAAAAAAPFSTYWLATMGAEVIKVESYEHLDVARRIEPYADGIPGENRGGMFNSKGINKRSCTLNLGHPKAQELALELVKRSDVVIENFSYRVAQRLDITYARVRQVRSDVIMVTCSAMGRTGPLRELPGYNENLTAFSGVASLTGFSGGPPGVPGGTFGDYLSGATLALATVMALYHRRRTGEGQYIDLAMAEALTAQIPEAILDYTLNGVVRGRRGNADDVGAPHGCFPCQGTDQWVAIAVFDDRQWNGLKQALDCPAWAEDARFAELAGRREHADELNALLGDATRRNEVEHLVSRLQSCGVPAGPVLDTPGKLADPHMQARGFYVTVDHPETGPRVASGLPFRFSRHLEDVEYRHAPLLGEDNEYVFQELLGLTDQEFAELVAEQVIW